MSKQSRLNQFFPPRLEQVVDDQSMLTGAQSAYIAARAAEVEAKLARVVELLGGEVVEI